MSKRGPDRSGGQQGGFNKRRSHGKPMLKMLCPYYCAGAIIGKGGETIKELMDKTDCDVKISKNDERFPTTSERVISVQGDQSAVEECILFSQEKIRKDEPPPNAKRESHAINAKRKEACKLVVSDTSAGRIIGKGGQRIKDLKNDYSVVINITRKDELPRGFEERCVSVEGEDGNVDNCVKEIIKLVCEDDSASMEWHVFYNDWSERREDRGFDGGRDMGRDNYSGRVDSRDGYGSRDSYRDSSRDYGSRDYGGRDGFRDSYNDRRDSFGDRDGGRDHYSGGRDYSRDPRDNYRDDSFNDRDRGYSRDVPRDGGARDGYGPRDSFSDRDMSRNSYGGGRDGGYGGRVDDRRDDYSRGDNFGRDVPRDSFGGRDSYGRDGGRDSGRFGGSGGGGGYNDRDRRDDYRARDIPQGAGRY